MVRGIAYRAEGEVMFIDMAASPGTTAARKLTATPAQQTFNSYSPWSPWGTNNLFPQEMLADIESCGILNAIIDGKARFALCEGIVPAQVERDENGVKKVKKWINDKEINSFLRNNNHFFQCVGWFRDLFGMGNAAVQYMVNGERNKIIQFRRIDISEMRYQKEDPNNAGKIDNVYLCSQWDKVSSAKDNRVKAIMLLDPNSPVEDLRKKIKSGIVETALTAKYPAWGKHYYSLPLWYAAYKWVKIAQGVPEMKAAMFENTMRLKYKVTIYPKYWGDAFPGQWDKFTDTEKEAKRNQLFDEIANFLVGTKNSGKSIFVDGQYDQISGKQYSNIDIEPIEDNTKQGEYLPDSAAANSEIAFAMLWNNALTGGNQASGLYEQSQGGSNVRESFLMQVLIHVFERELINYLLWPVAEFNGWTDKYENFEWVIPATILTTTDTGGSVKPTMQPNNGADKNNTGNQGGTPAAGK
jgi:hypothetical protein